MLQMLLGWLWRYIYIYIYIYISILERCIFLWVCLQWYLTEAATYIGAHRLSAECHSVSWHLNTILSDLNTVLYSSLFDFHNFLEGFSATAMNFEVGDPPSYLENFLSVVPSIMISPGVDVHDDWCTFFPVLSVLFLLPCLYWSDLLYQNFLVIFSRLSICLILRPKMAYLISSL